MHGRLGLYGNYVQGDLVYGRLVGCSAHTVA